MNVATSVAESSFIVTYADQPKTNDLKRPLKTKPKKYQIGSTNPQVIEHICFKHLVTNHLT